MRTLLRQQLVCYWLQLKMLCTSAFEGFLAVLFPLMFATATLMRLPASTATRGPASTPPSGAAIMGMWTCQGVVAATLLDRERWAGTLELVVAAPTLASAASLVPITMAMSTIGLYCVVATILWERWRVRHRARDRELAAVRPQRPGRGGVTLALIGFFLAVTAVRYRTSWALGAALEYPGWLLCGFVVPLDRAARRGSSPISWAIPTTWAMEAVRVVGRGSEPVARPRCSARLIGAAYAVLAAWLGRRLVDSARRNATLALT